MPDRYLCRNTTSMFLPLCLPKPPNRSSAGAFVLLLAWLERQGRGGEAEVEVVVVQVVVAAARHLRDDPA